jgi:hypothetical protein
MWPRAASTMRSAVSSMLPPRPRSSPLRLGMLPALTPMRMGTSRAFASLAMSATLVRSVMFPGFSRRQDTPASSASRARGAS